MLQVKFKVYWEYAKAVGPFLSLFICFLYGCQSAAAIGANFWLSEWTNDAHHNRTQEKVSMRVGVYATLGISQGTVRYSEHRHANANLTSLVWLCYLTNHRNTDWTPGHIISFTSTIKGQFTQKSKVLLIAHQNVVPTPKCCFTGINKEKLWRFTRFCYSDHVCQTSITA